MSTFDPAKTAYSRVFIIEGGAAPNHAPDYESCLKAGGITQGLGDIEMIECPDPERYGEFIEVGRIQGAKERPTSTLTGRFPADAESTLFRLGQKRCVNDVQYHFGKCTDARDFNSFTKAIIWEDVSLTNYSTEDLGALGSDESAKVDESADISAARVYEALPLTFAKRCDAVITNPVVDVVICDTPSCGDCEVESDGCQKIFAVTANTPGSPGTAPDLIWSDDGMATCHADDITSMLSTETATALACLGDYVAVTSNDSGSLHYKTKVDILAGLAALWTEIATGIVAGGEPNDIWSVGDYAFIVGDLGYVYGTADPTAGVTVLDAGVATTQNLAGVHALSADFAVAVGASDAIVFTKNGTNWEAAAGTTGSGANLTCVWVKSETEWWIGTATGAVYYTLNGGQTFTLQTLPGAPALNAVYDIAFATASVGYICGGTVTPRGRALRTFSGGGQGVNGWTVLPEKAGTAMPLTDAFYALAACLSDPNFVVLVGLADDASDGVMVVGAD